MWKLRLRPRNSQKRNIKAELPLQCMMQMVRIKIMKYLSALHGKGGTECNYKADIKTSNPGLFRYIFYGLTINLLVYVLYVLLLFIQNKNRLYFRNHIFWVAYYFWSHTFKATFNCVLFFGKSESLFLLFYFPIYTHMLNYICSSYLACIFLLVYTVVVSVTFFGFGFATISPICIPNLESGGRFTQL
jgi:hypothetical protein